MNILITGATGNVGREVIKAIFPVSESDKVFAGVRDVDRQNDIFNQYPQLQFRAMDMEAIDTFDSSFSGIELVFLLRPPQISDAKKYFQPMIDAMVKAGVSKIIFLSVQGVENSSVIPHHKIEQIIRESALEYVFVRPSYFMQNIITTLYADIKKDRRIYIPAGKAKFLWIDAKNIGESVAVLINKFGEYKNNAYEITGTEKLTFQEAVDVINAVIDHPISYKSPNLLSFFMHKKKQGVAIPMIFVMIMLHYLNRFQKEPVVSDWYQKLTDNKPLTLREFIMREKDKF